MRIGLNFFGKTGASESSGRSYGRGETIKLDDGHKYAVWTPPSREQRYFQVVNPNPWRFGTSGLLRVDRATMRVDGPVSGVLNYTFSKIGPETVLMRNPYEKGGGLRMRFAQRDHDTIEVTNLNTLDTSKIRVHHAGKFMKHLRESGDGSEVSRLLK